jgi:hypothetical protein
METLDAFRHDGALLHDSGSGRFEVPADPADADREPALVRDTLAPSWSL